jgi:hypothetical protein
MPSRDACEFTFIHVHKRHAAVTDPLASGNLSRNQLLPEPF